nr:MAG TPA: hypothetical protein [Bacteriophage sp.]
MQLICKSSTPSNSPIPIFPHSPPLTPTCNSLILGTKIRAYPPYKPNTPIFFINFVNIYSFILFIINIVCYVGFFRTIYPATLQ